MKKSLSVLTASLTMSVVLGGCNLSPLPVSSSSSVKTSLSMTGSAQNAVTQTRLNKLFSFFIPSAVALTPPLLFDSTSLSVSLSEAWVVVKEIEFESEEVAGGSEQDGSNIEFRGPYFVDLLSDAPISFGDLTLPASGLRRVKMQLHESISLPAGAPAGLSGKSIYFNGTVNGVAFSYAADDSTELEIGGPNPIVPSSAKDMLIVIKMADMFKKIDLSSIAFQTDITTANRVGGLVNPCPLIDSSATDLYTCFRKGLSSEGNFGNDDGDHDLDSHDETVD